MVILRKVSDLKNHLLDQSHKIKKYLIKKYLDHLVPIPGEITQRVSPDSFAKIQGEDLAHPFFTPFQIRLKNNFFNVSAKIPDNGQT